MHNIILTRICESSPSKIINAWSEEEHFKKWWNPPHCSITIQNFSFQKGGFIKYSLETQEKDTFWESILIKKIPHKGLEFVKSYSNDYWKFLKEPVTNTRSRFILNITHKLSLVEYNSKTIMILECKLSNGSLHEEKLLHLIIDYLKMDLSGKFDRLKNFLEVHRIQRSI